MREKLVQKDVSVGRRWLALSALPLQIARPKAAATAAPTEVVSALNTGMMYSDHGDIMLVHVLESCFMA